MSNQDNPGLDGQLAYLKPKESNWQALSEESFLVHNFVKKADCQSNKLTDDDKKEVAKNQQYLNDTLSKALQLPNLSLFAGSGASLAEVNGPSMSDLWRKSMFANPENNSDMNDTFSDDANAVLEKVKYTETQNPNIEHFLSQCDAYLLFYDDEEVKSFLYFVKKVILEECSEFIEKPDSDLSAYKGLLQKLARRRVRDPRLKVFTTNYDMCFETSASDLGMMIVDGFSYTRKRRFDGRFFTYDVVRRENENQEFVEGVMQLYKLHGSVSWERNGSDIVECAQPSPENAALIYPAKGKYQQAFIQPYLELLSRFLESLRQPNSCLLISGFGFNDDHLSEPIYSAIKSNPSLKLIIADYKAASHIKNKESNESSPYWHRMANLSQEGYDIHFINGSFNDFVSLIPHLRALSPAEQLVKAVKQASN
jgi:hypothetical protein